MITGSVIGPHSTNLMLAPLTRHPKKRKSIASESTSSTQETAETRSTGCAAQIFSKKSDPLKKAAPKKSSRKHKVAQIPQQDVPPGFPLKIFTSYPVHISTVQSPEKPLEANIFLTLERSHSGIDGTMSCMNRSFTLRASASPYSIGSISIDYYSTHLWIEKVQNHQPTLYKGVGSALVELSIRESFVEGRNGYVRLYSHGRTAGFYWRLGFTPLAKTICIPRYPGLKELTEKLSVCKQRLSRITDADEEFWPMVAEAQKILAQEHALNLEPGGVVLNGEYVLQNWFWKSAAQPMVSVKAKDLFLAFFEEKSLLVEGQKYDPLPSEEVLAGEMRLSQKVARTWRSRVLGS